jgi:hypothetical protein
LTIFLKLSKKEKNLKSIFLNFSTTFLNLEKWIFFKINNMFYELFMCRTVFRGTLPFEENQKVIGVGSAFQQGYEGSHKVLSSTKTQY